MDNEDLILDAIPQLSAICVTITKRYMLEQAIKHGNGIKLTDDDNNMVMASVKIDLLGHAKNMQPTQQLFYGEPAHISEDAIESTCSAALAYLLNMNIITIVDASSTELKKCQRELTAERFWSSVLYDRAKFLQDQLTSISVPSNKNASVTNANSCPANKCNSELEKITLLL